MPDADVSVSWSLLSQLRVSLSANQRLPRHLTTIAIKLRKITKNSSGLKKIHRKIRQTRGDLYFLFLKRKIEFYRFEKSGYYTLTFLVKLEKVESMVSDLCSDANLLTQQLSFGFIVGRLDA